MGFYTALEKENNTTFTENGDIAYRQVLKAKEYKHNLKLFGLGGAMRFKTNSVRELFGKAFAENEALAVQNMFYLRDCRGGKGERELFRACLGHAADAHPERIKNILPFILEYGRGDDLLELVEKRATGKAVCTFIKSCLDDDIRRLEARDDISILAKWLPKPNATSLRKRKIARMIAKQLGMSENEYRRIISKLRSRLNLVETALTNKETGLNYPIIPSQAMHKYSGYASHHSKHMQNAFDRNDGFSFNMYKEWLSAGRTSINAATLNPVQVFSRRYFNREIAEAQWKEIEKRVPVSDKRIVVVRDGSGSMCGTPLDVATSLSILAAGKLTGEFKDKFITFSSSPKLVDLSGCVGLAEKAEVCLREADCSNTNIEATYDLILETSRHCAPGDYITDVIVISDMQFDMGTDLGYFSYRNFLNEKHPMTVHKNKTKSTFERARLKFKEAGIPFPTMIYWNVAARELSFPTDTIEGVRFVSGYSDAIFTSLLEHGSVDAVEFMKKTLGKYDKCAKAWEGQ